MFNIDIVKHSWSVLKNIASNFYDIIFEEIFYEYRTVIYLFEHREINI